MDLNVTLGWLGMGITGGVMFDDNNSIWPYIGVGFLSPGVSLTFSSDDPAHGINVGLQGAYGIAGQWGISINGITYFEKGIGYPGVSVTSYYVFGPFLEKKKDNKPCRTK